MVNPFWTLIENDIPRLMGQLDTNPFSKTFGSFDRAYWHLRRVDFSSSALQQGVLVLSFLYSFKFENNPLYQNAEVLEQIKGALKYTFSIQHKDGSLDEWYPQERGWAGPTGYVLYAVIHSLELLGEKLEPDLILSAKNFSQKAVNHLLFYEEPDILSNHQAMAILAIEAAKKYFNLSFSEKVLSERWSSFFESFSDEGWSLEYDGCDPGYQSATLSFLSRLYRVRPTEEIKNLCLKQIIFLKQFVFPDLSFAGSLGSRGTINVFHFGFEFWAKESKEAKEISELSLAGVTKGTVLAPRDQEDHYLIYRLVEFLECAAIYQQRESTAVWEQTPQNKYYSESGLFRLSNQTFYGVLNLKKGGAGKIYQLNNFSIAFEDAGYFFQDEGGKLFTSSFLQKSCTTSIQNSTLIIEGYCTAYRRPVFDQFNFLLFRGFLFFIRSSGNALRLKKWIRSKIMTHFSVTKKIKISRRIEFGESLKISDTITLQNIKIKQAFRCKMFPSRAVPQSLYFSKAMLAEKNTSFISHEKLEHLNNAGTVTLSVV